MARNSPGAGGTGVTSVVVNAAGRIGWALLLPFGLANLAYWSRALPEANASRTGWRAGRGAAGIRAFALGLTILLVSTVCEVALDLFAVQCYPAAPPGSSVRVQACLPVLPTWLDRLADTGIATRLGYASVVPVLALLGLWFLTSRSRLRYEEITEARSDDDGSTRTLACKDLWQGGVMVRGLTQLHVAAGFAVIVIASAWPALFGTGPDCQQPLSTACLHQVTNAPATNQWWFGAVLIAAFTTLIAIIVLVCRRASDAPDVPGDSAGGVAAIVTWVTLIVAATLLGLQLYLLHRLEPGIVQEAQGTPLPLPGVKGAPTLVVAVLVGIAASALAWRARPKFPGILGILVTAGLLGIHFQPWGGTAAVVVGIVLLLMLACGVDEETRRTTAWAGMAPGVLLGLSLFAALTLSTLIVVGAGDWLNGSANASQLVHCPSIVTTTRPHALCVAPAYLWFGAGTVITVGLVIILAIVLIVGLLIRDGRKQELPPAPLSSGPGEPRVLPVRNAAALAHRAERITGIVAALGLAMVVIAAGGAAVPTDRWPATGTLADLGVKLANLGAAFTAAAAAAVVLAFSGTGLLNGRRPLGLVWDLLCFLPRAAHPFSPPCYAERAVPEITGRVRRWLAVGGRSVVLSAHSLGAVLAVAVVFVLSNDQLRSVQLITYGVQLRSYFGRILPDLLGGAVLGTPSCRAATLWGADPWDGEIEQEKVDGLPVPGLPPDSVRYRLDGRWISLWRRTDYLGFPAFGYLPNNPVDRPAEETRGSGAALVVGTHGNYPRTTAYAEALKEASARAREPGQASCGDVSWVVILRKFLSRTP